MRLVLRMEFASRMTAGQDCLYQAVNKPLHCGLKRGDIVSNDRPSRQHQNTEGAAKLPLTSQHNLNNQLEVLRTTMQAEKKTSTGSRALSKPPCAIANIKEKISKWEGKESSPYTLLATTTAAATPTQNIVKRPESLTKSDAKSIKDNGKENVGKAGDSRPTSQKVTKVPAKTTESLKTSDARSTVEEDRSQPASKAKQQNNGKENVGKAGDSRPTSPVECVMDVTLKRKEFLKKTDIQPSQANPRGEFKRPANRDKHIHGKENVGKAGDFGPMSPAGYVKEIPVKRTEHLPSEEQHQGPCSGPASRERQQSNGEAMAGSQREDRPAADPVKEQVMGMLKKDNTRKQVEQSAVFTLFKKLEQTMREENPSKSPLELPGNYFCPPSTDTQVEVKRRELESILGRLDDDQLFRGLREDWQWEQDLENVYTEPGTPPINPVPKPQRTFQQRTFHHSAKSEGSRSLQRPGKGKRNLPPLPLISPPPLHSQPSPNSYRRPRTDVYRDRNNCNRKSFELEDIPSCHPPYHHYEVIPDCPKENPYEDIEVSSQCSSQPSLPSSPGSECSKISRPGFFRQNSGGRRNFRLSDMRKTNHLCTDSGGRGSPGQLSPPSTPHSPDDLPHWLSGGDYNRICRRIPTDVLKMNSIFEARIGKKHLRRVFHFAEASSGRVTDENTDSESETEDRGKAHRQRLSTVQSILSQPGQGRYGKIHSSLDGNLKELHQRQLFEYFLVVALHKAKAGSPYIPEVAQHFPLKLERSFKFMRETEDQLRIIPQFCFPDAKDWEPVENYPSEMFSFVLTGEDGSRRFGYCRRLLPSGKGKRLPEVYCIVSHLGCFHLFSKVLDEVERRRALSPALVQPFMRAIMEAPFPAPGRTITIKTFLPGSGTEMMELCRPSDSRLEHVDFECLFSCLSLRLLLRIFGSLLLERRIIFTADKLSTLSQCCHAVVALLYPFTWQHTYIPVLPPAMLDIVCTPTPFIVGLLSSSLPQLTELPLEEVLMVDLGNSRFLRQLDDEDSILPSKLQSALETVLERRRELASERGGDNDFGHLSTVVSEAFVRFFVELVGHYPLFITEREDDSSSFPSFPPPSLFQREAFRKSVSSKSLRRFLDVFMETQMFGLFIQEREYHRQAMRGLFEVRVQEYLDSIHDNEHRRVNKFLKGLGNKMKFLSKK
ncbi:DENN domain-containing protein 2A isoform X2 [Esox lucius]|uniref:UDENN domain-containing protein n=1 Tax=Esox lucius TaxID=8010 RepID=A0A3P8ZP52_ESOLU|nr:DENN domain-containing protein 2A isoform X2 [Esox lucius]